MEVVDWSKVAPNGVSVTSALMLKSDLAFAFYGVKILIKPDFKFLVSVNGPPFLDFVSIWMLADFQHDIMI